jgi:hypothetical protein
VRAPDRPRRAEQVDLIHPRSEDLAGHVARRSEAVMEHELTCKARRNSYVMFIA